MLTLRKIISFVDGGYRYDQRSRNVFLNIKWLKNTSLISTEFDGLSISIDVARGQ